MLVYLVDTNAISDLMSGHPRVVANTANHPGRVLGSVIAWGEIVDGLARLPVGKRRARLRRNAAQAFALLSWQVVTVPIAETYGNLKALLVAQGLSVGDNDLWIAAMALQLGAAVVTRDQDFGHVPGLQVDDWTK